MKGVPGAPGFFILRSMSVLGMKADVGTISAHCTAFNNLIEV